MRGLSSRRLGAAAVAVATVAVLAGCQAQVGTSVEVTGPSASTITETVAFDGEVAQAFLTDPTHRTDLEKLLAQRFGGPAQRHESPGHLAYTREITYPQLTGSSDVTGVCSASLSGTASAATFHADLCAPTALRQQLLSSVASQADSQALAQTLLQSTQVSLSVHFAGGISAWDAPVRRNQVQATGNEVTVSQQLDTYQAGAVSVTGDPRAPLINAWNLGLVGALMLAAVAATWFLRRNQSARRT
jgi:hypothetical protein